MQGFSDIEIYFHVGVERTGTKYLQKSIFPTYKGIHFINKDEYFNAKQIIAKRKHKRYLVSMELNLSPQFEAEVKDSKQFPKEPGYWAFFSFSTPDHKSLMKTAKAFPAKSCNACHEDAAADDWVFTQYYPVLRAAKMAAGK